MTRITALAGLHERYTRDKRLADSPTIQSPSAMFWASTSLCLSNSQRTNFTPSGLKKVRNTRDLVPSLVTDFDRYISLPSPPPIHHHPPRPNYPDHNANLSPRPFGIPHQPRSPTPRNLRNQLQHQTTRRCHYNPPPRPRPTLYWSNLYL